MDEKERDDLTNHAKYVIGLMGMENVHIGCQGEKTFNERSRHDEPAPNEYDDISKSQAMQEWVFNHLPLTQNQKKDLLQDITLENSIQNLKERSKTRCDKVKSNRRKTIRKEHLDVYKFKDHHHVSQSTDPAVLSL